MALKDDTGKAQDAIHSSRAAVGKKDDAGKARWRLFPWTAAKIVLNVLEHGAKKYGEDNWKLVQDGERRYVDAAMRHLVAHISGEEMDEESGLPHLAHAACSVLFAIHMWSRG